ncbi:MAG TPA: DeoR/GlpR family DNA-binding transcription regulator, partial [Spirochaetia bacterium]|nr:DeoR/GlpR family DNA-binding transcription regulator [Spirochaetia bacterium]
MAKRDFVEERRNKILEYVNKNSRADVTELADFHTVTEATIRRDLVTLEKQGRVYRAHGGALRREPLSVWQISRLQDRIIMHLEEKTRIAQFVTQLVHDGESLMIDGGSTTMLVAQKLRVKKNLLVVTNAPAIGELMIEDNKVILTGGELLKETQALLGSAAEQSLKQYRTDKAIIGVSGILVNEGCFSAIPQEAEIKRLMSLNSSETILVSDSSKIGARAFS